MSLTKLSLVWNSLIIKIIIIIKLFPARESLVSDIPAGDGKIDNLFYTLFSVSCGLVLNWALAPS